jgi:2,3-bisphosphoglycerate-dependent phosphoglycerate mutase
MESTRICLVRHGETDWNAEKRIQGQIDIALNAVGQRQAAAAAHRLSRLPVTALYSSDLLRARQTAERIAAALDLSPSFVPAFRERAYGLFEGLTYDEARLRHPADYRAFAARDPDYALPAGGESLRQCHQRAIGHLRRLAAEHRGQSVVLVTHGGVLDLVNRFVRGNPLELPRDFQIPNAGITWVSVTGDRWVLEVWGDTAHLSADGRDELP